MRVLIKDVPACIDSEVIVAGWVHRIRKLGAITFVLLRDRSGIMQLVFEKPVDLAVESVVRASGTVAKNAKSPGGYEVHAERLEMLSRSATPLPYQPNTTQPTGIETTLDQRMLSVRTPRINACFRVQSAIIDHFGQYMRSQDFTEIKSSKLVSTYTEGGAGLFTVNYFGRSVFLAQSPQFYKQAMVASGMERVFEIGAAYRAEKHETARHLNEYVSLDVEIGFIDTVDELIDLEVAILSAIAAGVRSDCAALIEEYDFALPDPAALRRAPRIDYKEALAIISARGSGRVFEINPEGERLLTTWAQEEHDTDLLFVHSFPVRKRPFYTYPDGNATKSFDCIFRGIEITTGGVTRARLCATMRTDKTARVAG